VPVLPRMRDIIELNSRDDARVGVHDQDIERQLADVIDDRVRAAAALEIDGMEELNLGQHNMVW